MDAVGQWGLWNPPDAAESTKKCQDDDDWQGTPISQVADSVKEIDWIETKTWATKTDVKWGHTSTHFHIISCVRDLKCSQHQSFSELLP